MKGILSLVFDLVIINIRDGPTLDSSRSPEIRACIERYWECHVRLLGLPHDTRIIFSIHSAGYVTLDGELDRFNDALAAVGTQIRASTHSNSSVCLTNIGGLPLLPQSIAVAFSAATPDFLFDNADWLQL